MNFETTRKIAIAVAALALSASLAAQAQESPRNRLLNRGLTRPSAAPAATPAAANPNAVAEASAVEEQEDASRDLNFRDAPVDMVFAVYGKLVDKTVLKDPQTPNVNITLESRPGQKLTKEEQIEAIEVVLEMNGIHIESYGESDKFVRSIARKDAGKEGIPLFMDAADEDIRSLPMGKVVSVMIAFKNISAQDEAQKALEGFKSATGLLQVFERTNTILVTDTRQNIVRMLEVSKAIDIATPVLENVYVRQIKNASAADIKTALEQIVQESQKELEKNGKAQQNAANSAASRGVNVSPGGSLLRRPGQNRETPAAPQSVESLVTSVSDADRGLIRGKVLILADERSNKLIIITSKSNMDFFARVIEPLDVETTPDTLVKVYRLKYAEAEDVADMINDLIGNSASSKTSTKSSQNPNARSGTGGNITRGSQPSSQPSRSATSSNQRSGEPKAGELSKENTTVLADKRINGIVVMTQKELVPTLENIIESMDVKLSQVLIETVIIEVTLGDDLKTGVDWVQRGKTHGQIGTETVTTGTDEDGNPITKQVPVYGTIRDTFVNRNNYALGGGGGAGTELLSTLMNAGTNATSAFFGGANPIGSGVKYLLKSDKLNLSAVIQASKTDNRAKYIASPVVMTVDNKEATIEATENRQFVTGWTAQSGSYGNSGQPTPNYSSKDIGIKVKITPKINPNGTVMLTVEEEYSQFVINGQNMLIPENGTYKDGKVDLARERKMSADILLENGQSVVLGGLTQTSTSESETGIPLLKDIPWIGKWLFGSVEQSESRNELLVFMTPYVLDDAEAAQAEALRRKKSLSDPRPWDDHEWSASALADPVSKKELMRRLKDEAKKQDEERQTKLAVEKWKLERAKALEKMDESERKFWIDTHRDELEKDEKKRFDEAMKEQADLKALAAQIREQRLEKAEAKIDEANEAERAENEHSRLEAEKARKRNDEGGDEQVVEQPAEPVSAPAVESVAVPAVEPVAEPAEVPVAEPVQPSAEPADNGNLLNSL